MTENKNNTPQEIDLIELFGNIWNWSTGIFLAILYFFLRNILLFIFIGIIAGILGFSSYNFSTPFYKTELFGKSNTISNIETILYLNSWNYEKVFTEDELKKIKNISGKYLLDLNGDEIWDIVEENDIKEVTDTSIINKRISGAFCIQAELYDPSIMETIKTKAFEHLTNNKRVIDINNIRLEQQHALIPKIKKEIADLDSLKNLQYFETNKTNGKAGDLMILNEKDVQLYHKDIIELYERQQRIERELFLSSDPFEITQDFTIPRYQENSLSKLLIKYVKIGFALGFLLIILWDRRKGIKKLLKDSRV